VSSAFAFVQSSIGKKWIVALTGLVMFLFVIGHMIGNLQIFLGPEAINNYGALLRTSPELLWLIRSILLAALVLHVIFSVQVRVESRKAQPTKYAVTKRTASTLSSRMMMLTGLLLLAFIIFHLLHFTAQTVDPSFVGMHDEKGRHDVYRMVIEAFSKPAVSIFYVIAMALLCSHLSHGAWSWLQTLGLRTKKIADGSTRGARILALLLALGYISIPAAVLFAHLGRGYVAERKHAEQVEAAMAPIQPVISPTNP
jgi:succinate dehydrogenase / fumarate reductase, cytochrome b subunit